MKYVAGVLLCLCIGFSQAQGIGDKLYFGGGFGFNTSSTATWFSLSPIVGYKVTDRLSVGTGISWQYTGYKNVNLELNHWGINPFSRFMLTRQLFLTVEYEYLSVEYAEPNTQPIETARIGWDSFMGGAGFVQPLGGVASLYMIGLYNFTHDDNDPVSPYGSPWIFRAGISVGF